jgi:phage terminase large subunit
LNINVETRIKLDKFTPRDYQLPILDAIENKGYKKVLAILPRRAGKDMTAFQLCIRQCIKKVCTIYYIFPTYSQGKKILFDAVDSNGFRVLDYIPNELVESKNAQEMKIRFKNGSLFQVIGSDNYDSLVGTNPYGIVFSEWALQNPFVYSILRPILAYNGGWCLFITTPRGKNHVFEMYQIALLSPDWFVYRLTIEDTNHISLAEIEKDRQDGTMSDDLIMQEYYCSFDMGVEGAYYAKYLDKMRINNQIGLTPWEPAFKVHTAWDLGVRDNTSIIFYQTIGQSIRIIDCYEKSKEGLEHYAKILQQKPYTYGKHMAPHDIAVREFGSGMTRLEKAKQLGISFTVTPNLSIEDGIEAVRSTLSKVWIDEVKCAPLIKSLENYRQEFDNKKKIYMPRPLHNWASHFADSMRYLCVSLSKTKDGLSAEDLDKRYNEAMYGNQHNFPRMFRD